MESQLDLIKNSFLTQYTNWVYDALDELPLNFTITDPCISGHPIVFASNGFLKMCGYLRDEVIGRNGRMFQGPKTNRRSVMEIREAIREERESQVCLLNYRRDGRPFWMLFHMSPVFGKEDGRVIHFVAVQVPIVRRRVVCSGSGFVGKRVEVCDHGFKSGEVLLGACRREVCSDSVGGLGRGLVFDEAVDSDEGAEVEDVCEASQIEKQKASAAISNILSVLAHYSELTGRLVSGSSCRSHGRGLLCSALNISLGRIKQSFVLIEPHLSNMPIVYASDAFLKLTGYARHEVLGCSHIFLSGLDTDTSTLSKVNGSIHTGQPCTVRLLNYRKDRTSFWSILHVSPVRNASGKIAYFVEVHAEEDEKEQAGNVSSPKSKHLSVVGAVKVAVRSLSMGPGPSKS
ncbi:hypothetical protein Droror1_Dr00018438 [Drosera rotundifolia]